MPSHPADPHRVRRQKMCVPSAWGARGRGSTRSMAIATENRDVLLALEPRPESARLARRALASSGLHEDVEHTVTLLATEIVGNAVRHAGLRADQRIVFFARLARTSPGSRSPTRATASIPNASTPRASACACSPSSRAGGAWTATIAGARSGSRSTAARAASAAPPPPDPGPRAAPTALSPAPDVRPDRPAIAGSTYASQRAGSVVSDPCLAVTGTSCSACRCCRWRSRCCSASTGLSPDVLLAVPAALLLLLPLLAGRYVGEDGLARLARSRTAPPPRRSPARIGARRRAPRVLPRGGRLIAAALAERGPPAPAAAR